MKWRIGWFLYFVPNGRRYRLHGSAVQFNTVGGVNQPYIDIPYAVSKSRYVARYQLRGRRMRKAGTLPKR